MELDGTRAEPVAGSTAAILARKLLLMTQPLKSGEPGRSEFSHGKGMMTNPESDFQSQRALPFAATEGKRAATDRRRAEFRSDPTNGAETILPDMYYSEGNPDMFGPQPPMVREKAVRPSGKYPQPTLRYGVDRQG